MREFATDFIPGLRIIKTGVAVLICLVTFYLFDYYNPVYAAIACVLIMKTTVADSFNSGVQRVVGTILGGALSWLLLVLLRQMGIRNESFLVPLFITLGVVLVLSISKAFHAAEYVGSMAAVVLVITMLSHVDAVDDTFMYVLVRVLETIYGIFIAVMVNRYLNPGLFMKEKS